MPATDDPTAPGRSFAAESAAAVAAALGALGYGLFVWQQPGDLDGVAPFAVTVDSSAAATPVGDDDAVELDATDAMAATASIADVLVDEDPTDAGPVGSLDPAAPVVDVLGLPAVEVLEGSADDVPSSYSTSPDTIAMLEEIAFLDE